MFSWQTFYWIFSYHIKKTTLNQLGFCERFYPSNRSLFSSFHKMDVEWNEMQKLFNEILLDRKKLNLFNSSFLSPHSELCRKIMKFTRNGFCSLLFWYLLECLRKPSLSLVACCRRLSKIDLILNFLFTWELKKYYIIQHHRQMLNLIQKSPSHLLSENSIKLTSTILFNSSKILKQKKQESELIHKLSCASDRKESNTSTLESWNWTESGWKIQFPQSVCYFHIFTLWSRLESHLKNRDLVWVLLHT